MLDLAIVLVFIAYSVGAGFRFRRQASRNLSEYFLAGRTVSGFRAGVSMAATQYAADTPLLVAGLLATGGVFSLWRLWIYALAFLLMGFLLGGPWRRSAVLTDPEFVSIRYSGKGVPVLRILKAGYFGVIFNCAVLAMVFNAAAMIFEIFLPWQEWLPEAVYGPIHRLVVAGGLSFASGASVLPVTVASTNNTISLILTLGFVGLYSTTGGLRSVITTDLVQFAIMILATGIFAGIVLSRVHGPQGLTENLVRLYGERMAQQTLSFTPGVREAFLPFVFVVALQWFFQSSSDGSGYLAQRMMACRSDRDARIAAVVFTFGQVLLRSLLWLPIAVGLLIFYPFEPGTIVDESFRSGREILFVHGIQDLLPTGVRGLMLVAMLAALASTIDTHLNWGASYVSNDLYRSWLCEKVLRRHPKTAELVVVARLSNLLIIIIAIVAAANVGSIQTAWHISLLFGAGMGPVLILRWLWERINLYSELTAIFSSLIIAPLLLFFLPAAEWEWMRLSLMALFSTVFVLAITLLSPPTEQAVLNDFYRRVSPPGFWRQTALSLNLNLFEPVKKLRRGLISLTLCTLSLFLLLYGFGRLLLPLPGGHFFEPWFSLLAGLALLPFWYRGMRR